MGEAQAQSASFIDYFCGILSFNPASHPYTFDLVCAVLKVGEFQAMHYKALFDRPRPSHLSPSLLPPLDPPGHAAFPSGHATQAYLLALCLQTVLPGEATWPMRRLAERIARNREVLGLHYPSDSKAGWVLAQRSYDILKNAGEFTALIGQARNEWS